MIMKAKLFALPLAAAFLSACTATTSLRSTDPQLTVAVSTRTSSQFLYAYGSALVLICAIIVHIYAAIWVKGSLTAMLRGYVTAGWAWKHHRAWFREQIRK